MNKQYILKKNHDIDSLVRLKQSVGNTYYAIYYRKSESLRVVVSVSKKLGKAVVRNYQKRVMKEILRNNIELIPSVDMLLVIKFLQPINAVWSTNLTAEKSRVKSVFLKNLIVRVFLRLKIR